MTGKILTILIAGLVLATVASPSVAQPPEIQPYKGWIGADSPLYGLKLFFQGLDESLSGNSGAKLRKQMAHAEERLTEAYAASLRGNDGAADAALHEYQGALDKMNGTMDDPDVDDDAYLEMAGQLERHQNHFRYMVNNSTLTPQSQNRWTNAFEYSERFKNGRPFMYCNNTSYFIPPSQMKKMNWSQVPPGLCKKGYVAPEPTVVNGKLVWPWDVDGMYDLDYSHNYDYNYDRCDNETCNCTEPQGNDYDYSYNNTYNNTYLSPGPHGSGKGNDGK